MARKLYTTFDWILLVFSLSIMGVGVALLGVAVVLYDANRLLLAENVVVVVLGMLGLALFRRETR
ncbi:MAG: hypothetical protein ACTSU5_10080 [Promethearchaeota archaeon]